MESSKKIENEKFPITQIIAALICNFGSLNCGLAVGWMSPALPQLLTPDNILSRMPKEEADVMSSWLAAVFPIGALCMTPFSAYLVDKFGKKQGGIITGIPFFIHGLLILVSDDIWWLLVGRFFVGIGASLNLAVAPSYIGEISSLRIRGRLASFMILTYTAGISMSYAVAGFISYKAGAMLMVGSAILGIVLFSLMPETPAFLYRHNGEKKAAKAIAWFHRCEIDDPIVTEQLDKFKSANLESHKDSIATTVKTIVSQKHHRGGLLLCIWAVIFQGCMGMVAVHSFSVSIFMESGVGDLTPEAASLVYGAIQISGALSAASIVDHSGRKVLFACSSFGVAICMTTMAGYFTAQAMGINMECISWIPVVALSLCVYTYTLGAGPVPFILLADVLSTEVRSFGIMICVQIHFLFVFLMLRFFGPISVIYGPQALFYFFGISGALSGIWILIFLPETKGKSIEDMKIWFCK